MTKILCIIVAIFSAFLIAKISALLVAGYREISNNRFDTDSLKYYTPHRPRNLKFINDTVYYFVVGDSVPIYSYPDEQADILRILNWGDSVKSNQIFRRKDNLLEITYAYSASNPNSYPWMSIKYDKFDSVWVKCNKITYRLEITNSNDFYIAYTYRISGADNLYIDVLFLEKIGDKLYLNKKLKPESAIDKGIWINDKTFAFINYISYHTESSVRLLDIDTETIKTIGLGTKMIYSDKNNKIVYLKDSEKKGKPSILCSFDIDSNLTDTLFRETTSGLSFSYVIEDNLTHSSIQMIEHNESEAYKLEMFDFKFMDDDDFAITSYEITVNEHGEIIDRKQKE